MENLASFGLSIVQYRTGVVIHDLYSWCFRSPIHTHTAPGRALQADEVFESQSATFIGIQLWPNIQVEAELPRAGIAR